MNAATFEIDEEPIDLHALRQRRASCERVPFLDVDTFEGQPSDPTQLHKYLYGGGNPVSNTDPSGESFIGEFLVANWGRLLLASSLLIGVGLAYHALRGVRQVAAAKAVATPFPDNTIAKNAVTYLQQYAGNVQRVKDLRQSFRANEISFFVLPNDQWQHAGEGTTTQGTNDLYIGRNILESHDQAAIALAIFGEFQHSSIGGNRLDNPEVQAEFEAVRRLFPRRDRTPLVNALHHGGQDNHQ